MKTFNMKIDSYLETFLLANLDLAKPILIGYSGGIDSQALATALLSLQKKLHLNLCFLHVDHGWRESSFEEALKLKNHLSSFPCHFIVERLTYPNGFPESNVEDILREKRYEVFLRYYYQIGAGALLLGHQRDDLAETVFKRIFEGASLSKIGGLSAESNYKGIKILRPFLEFDKQALENYLKIKSVFYIDDPTNYDSRYLRARQRGSIFPSIEKEFGKNAKGNLIKLSKKIKSLDEYLEKKAKRYHHSLSYHPLGVVMDFNTIQDLDTIELEWFLRSFFKKMDLHLSYQVIENITHMIFSKKANKKFLFSQYSLFIDRGFCFLIRIFPDQTFPETVEVLSEGVTFETESFVWILTYSNTEIQRGWLDLFDKGLIFDLCPGVYRLRKQNHDKINSQFLPKIPLFLKNLVPVFINSKEVISNPWLKTDETLKENYRVRLQCIPKIHKEDNFNGLKSKPLLSSKS